MARRAIATRPCLAQLASARLANHHFRASACTPLLLALSAALAWAGPTTSVHPAALSQVRYQDGASREAELRAKIQAKLPGALIGAGETARIEFTFTSDTEVRVGVRGSLLAWENLKVERYLVADVGSAKSNLERAVELAGHDRAHGPEAVALSLVEARGRRVLVISGALADDAQALRALREVVWANSPKRVDVLRRTFSSEDGYVRYSAAAIGATPSLRDDPRLQPGVLESLAPDQGSFVKQGTRERKEWNGSVLTLDVNPTFTALGLHSSPKAEHEMETAVASLLGSTGSLPASGSGGGLVGSLPAASPAGKPLELNASHDGAALRVRRGTQVAIRLRQAPGSTAASWRPASLPTGARLEVEPVTQTNGPPAFGLEDAVVRFTVDTVGTQRVRLELWRAHDTGPLDTYTVSLRAVE